MELPKQLACENVQVDCHVRSSNMELGLAFIWHNTEGLTFGIVMQVKLIAGWAARETALCKAGCDNPFSGRLPSWGKYQGQDILYPCLVR